MSCGTCRACNAAGACTVNSTDHADCGVCQKCASGSCVNQASTEDLKGECAATASCASLTRGWNGAQCQRFTGPSVQNGNCSGASAACSSLLESCTGALAISACGAGCEKPGSCPLGGAVTAYDERAEVCFMDWAPHSCPSQQVCAPLSGCEMPCTADNECLSNNFCCEYDNIENACNTQPCFCVSGGCFIH